MGKLSRSNLRSENRMHSAQLTHVKFDNIINVSGLILPVLLVVVLGQRPSSVGEV